MMLKSQDSKHPIIMSLHQGQRGRIDPDVMCQYYLIRKHGFCDIVIFFLKL